MTRDQAGDAGTLDIEALYRRERDRIYSMCLAILRDPGDAEDAVQETFARVAAHAGSLHADSAGYLIVAARNVCRDELRRRSRRGLRPTAAAARDASPEDAAVQRGLLALVWRQLAAVERRLVLDTFSGMSMAEIGERAGTSADVAAQRISRLRRRIRRMVAAPALLILPVLRGGAVPALSPQGALAWLLDRARMAEQVAGPVLVGIAAGALVLPPSGAARPPSAPPAAVAPQALQGGPPAAGPAVRAAAPGGLALAHGMPAVSALPEPSSAVTVVSHIAPKPPPDTPFTSFTPSPDYSQDHVVFATADTSGCNQPCASVWRSDDAGATWKPVTTTSFYQSTVALPPTWPADPTIFVLSTSNGVWRSDDGGTTFRNVVPTSGGELFVLDPSSSPGDTHIVVQPQQGTGTLLFYDASDGKLHPMTTLPVDTSQVIGFFAVPGVAAVYVELLQAETGPGGLYACVATDPCRRIGPVASPPTAFSPSFARDQTTFTDWYRAVGVTTLSGQQLGTVQLGDAQPETIIPAADYASSGTLDVVVMHNAADGSVVMGGMRVVVGRPPMPWALTLVPGMNWSSIIRLPGGQLLAGVARGAMCSRDDGSTWTPAC